MHGDKANFVADLYYKTQQTVKTWEAKASGGKLASVSFSQQMFQTVIQDLLCERGYKVEVWQGSGRKWSVAHRGSPGNLQGCANIFSLNNTHVLCCFLWTVLVSPS